MRIFSKREAAPSPLRPIQAQPGIDPGKTIVYQFAAWWLGIISLWFLVSILVVAPLTQDFGAVVAWAEINWNLKWLTLVLGLAGALPFYVLRARGYVSSRRYYVDGVNIESSHTGETDGHVRRSMIKPYRPLPPVFKVWWFEVPYDIGDGILELPMTLTGQHAPGIEPVPPTDLPPGPPGGDDGDGKGGPGKGGPRGSDRPDPPDSPYNDQNQGFSTGRRWSSEGDFAEDRKPGKF